MSRNAVIAAVRNLNIDFSQGKNLRHVVSKVSFTISRGEFVGLVGESGSGKSVTVRTLLGIQADDERVSADEFTLFGKPALDNSDAEWRDIRGKRIGFVLQDALTSLDPLKTIGYQVDEALTAHGPVSKTDRANKVVELLGDVGIPRPWIRQRQYPHELSGGLRQRALIASAMAEDPALIIADEPTTALDVTVQAQVLDLLRSRRDDGSAILLVSHDLAVVGSVCDRILVMKDGELVEEGTAQDILHHPRQEYTKMLLAAIPSASSRGHRLSSIRHEALPHKTIDYGKNLLAVKDICKTYRSRHGGITAAVENVSVDLYSGETLGIVGESGSGKSTVAKILTGLIEPDSGEVRLEDDVWSPLPERQRHARRQRIQMISQDPMSSFDPRYTVTQVIAEPLRTRKRYSTEEIQRRVDDALDLVQLPREYARYSPRRLSGGQRQRVAIARALVVDLSVLVADEAVSALDVSIQAQILDLLADIQAKTHIGIVFISHDLGVIHHIADKVIVMKDGHVVECGNADEVLKHPSHPYTRRLIAAIPTIPVDERMPR